MTKITLKRSLKHVFALALLSAIQIQALALACKVECHERKDGKASAQAPLPTYKEISGVQAEELTSLLIRAKLGGEEGLFVARDIEIKEKLSGEYQFFALSFNDENGALYLSQEGEILLEIASSLNLQMSKDTVGKNVLLKLNKISCFQAEGRCILIQKSPFAIVPKTISFQGPGMEPFYEK